MEKILITGTGRCGTTFLIKLFTFLEFDTGFNKNNYESYIYSNCNSGMEKQYNANHYILKNPTFIGNIRKILKDKSIKIKYVMIPIRDLKASAKSRNEHGNNNGGLWNATDETSQIAYYEHILSNYLYVSNKYDIATIFIDFDRMIKNKKYLFDTLQIILQEKEVDFNLFSKAYDEVSASSKPK